MRAATSNADHRGDRRLSVPRESGADWFLFSQQLYRELNDPKKLSAALVATVPADIARAIVAYSEMGLSGSLTINFRDGAVMGCDQQTHHPARRRAEVKRSA